MHRDVCTDPQGRFHDVEASMGGPARLWIDGVEIPNLPESLLYPRIASEGARTVVLASGFSDTAYLVANRRVQRLSTTYGTSPVVIRWLGGRFLAFVVSERWAVLRLTLNADGEILTTSEYPMIAGGSATGFLDIDPQTEQPIWVADARVLVGGLPALLPLTRGKWTVAQNGLPGAPNETWVWDGATLFVASQDDTPIPPRLAAAGDQVRVAISSEPDVPLITEADLRPYTGPSLSVLPAVRPFEHFVWTGPFFSTNDQYGAVETPGNCEVIVRGDFWKAQTYRKAIADLASSYAMPDGYLLAIWMGFEGGDVSEANVSDYDAAKAEAERRRVPLIVYFDADDYPDDVLDRFVTGPNLIPGFRAYPATKPKGAPLRATPAQDIARIRAVVDKLARRYPRVALARTCYTQSGNYPWAHVFAMQAGITDIVREYRVWADLWFAWLRDPKEALAEGPAELRRYVAELAAAVPDLPAPAIWLDGDPPPDRSEPSDPAPPAPEPQPPIDPQETEMNLPARCYALLHNSNIAAVAPGESTVRLAHDPQEYGPWQQIEVMKSREWTPENPRVLVRFVEANRLLRVDKVLAGERKYDDCLQTWDPAAADADSSWQQGLAFGPMIHFTSDSVDGTRHGVVYTVTCVDEFGRLFR